MKSEKYPAAWKEVTLAEVAADVPNAIVDGPFGSNLKTSDYVEFGVPVLQGKNITNDSFKWFDVRYVSKNKANELIRSSVRVGDILLVKIGSIGYSAIVYSLENNDFAIIPANLVKVTPNKSKVDLVYLHRWLTSPQAKSYLISNASKTAQPALSLRKIRELPLPLPPLPEQRRIAAILDQADMLRAKRREALAELDRLTQSIFVEMFGDPVSNPKGWPENVTLGEVAELASGVTKGRNLSGKVTRTVPYLAVANVQDKALNLSNVKYIEATEDEIKRYLLKDDDLLLTEGGDPDKLGRGTLWKGELAECIHQNHIFRVRVTSPQVNPLFLNWIIGSQRGKKYFLRSAKQTTGIASINMTQLRSFPLFLPPIRLQNDFSKIVAKVSEQHAICSQAYEEANALFTSLQHRAFRGEL